PHTWPPAIGELDASGLQYSAYGCHCLGIACILARLDLGDGTAVEARLFRQLLNGPIKQATRGPYLRWCHDPIRSSSMVSNLALWQVARVFITSSWSLSSSGTKPRPPHVGH